MAGGAGHVPRPRSQAAARGARRKHQTPSLPLDIVLEIAACSDPATLVRCAATCSDVRRRVVADYGGQAFCRLLRLRHADRFVPSLLRGHLEYRCVYDNIVAIHLVDITAGADTSTARLLTSADGFPPHPDGKTTRQHKPVASRDGLLLLRTSDCWKPLHVWDPATGRSQTLPPVFLGAAQICWEPYVLLVADGEAGGAASDGFIRGFQVLKANLVMSEHHRYLQTQTFSSKNGAWGTYTEIRTPHLHGTSLLCGGRPMVSGGTVHWLCITKSGGYILKLHIRTAQVTVTVLPVSFPSFSKRDIDYLLATTTAGGGELMVLVADSKKKSISAWVQTKPMAKWKQRPQVVMEYEAMLRFRNIRSSQAGTFYVQLHWFAERSGLLLLSSYSYGEFWLDLRSMEIVRWFPAGSSGSRTHCLPYEMNLSSWVPTFSSTII